MERMKKSMSIGGGAVADEQHIHRLKVYLNRFNSDQPPLKIDFYKRNTVEELIQLVLAQNRNQTTNSSPSPSTSCFSLSVPPAASINEQNSHQDLSDNYELCEIMGTLDGQTCKERRLDPSEYPVAVQLLWPKTLPTGPDETTNLTEYRFVLREKRSGKSGVAGRDSSVIDVFLQRFLQQPKDKEYPDLCMLPELTEQTLLENLRDRFNHGHIYTYIGPILVAVNPFKFFPIYNPKYAKMYENHRNDLPPHIFAIADAAYYTMLRKKKNQCIVISGESGSGKTESTNFLLHHLTTLSQKGAAGTGIEQTLLAGGPVLEAFGNAVTAQNNNSSRFGKFIQVNYRENGIVYGASVQIYLLEKSRITSQPAGERNYHVFYYLLAGASDEERQELALRNPEDYHYLNQEVFQKTEGVDEKYEFKRLKQSMELVGFSAESQKKMFSVLSAVLLLGNIQYTRKSGYHSDDTALIANPEVVKQISLLLQVKEEKLLTALTIKRTMAKNDVVLTLYKVAEAATTRDAMAKSLYNALFDWIVLRINQALMKKDFVRHHQNGGASNSSGSPSYQRNGYNIGILDIFGFEDVGGQWNSFEQFCINYANERLQAYFNEHIFQFEQEEYLIQGLEWTAIEYTDNTECLLLIQSKPYGLFCLIDEESSIPKGTDETLLEKLNKYHKNHEYYEMPHKKESAFIIAHYAGKVKYQVTGFREKNRDLMRQDVVNALKNSKSAFVRELVGTDPVAVFRWAVVRAMFRAMFAFKQAGREMMKKTLSVQHLNVVEDSHATRRSSESQLNAFLRGDIDERRLPSFCDSSVLSTIIEHARPIRSKTKFKQVPPWRHRPPSTSSSSSSDDEDCNDIVMTAADCVLSPAERNRHQLTNGINSRTYVRELVLSIEGQLDLSRKGPFRQKRSSSSQRQPKAVRGLQALKALAHRRPAAGRKMLSTVGAQFQHSLGRLMESLGHANPFFIRCIRSNIDKIPCFFDEDIILRQLRYTGMLETVRIRRAGYSVRLTYEEFAFHYRILLPNGTHSNKDDIVQFICGHPVLDRHNIQFGHTKMFMRDAEKLLLDDQLHRTILTHILRLQSWFRTFILRRRFLRIRSSVVKLQANIRGWLVRRSIQRRAEAALCIQTYWRRYQAMVQYRQKRDVIMKVQAVCRAMLIRQKYQHSLVSGFYKYNMPHLPLVDVLTVADQKGDVAIDTQGSGEKIGSPVQSDEGILTKTSSQDDFLPSAGNRVAEKIRSRRSDSEESSGIIDNADFSDTEHANQLEQRLKKERTTSLDATFVLEDKRLKLIKVDVESFRPGDETGLANRPRRPSLTPAKSASIKEEWNAQIRRATSSDHLPNNRITQSLQVPEIERLGGISTLPTIKQQKMIGASNVGAGGSFTKAKRQLKALLSRRSESFNMAESDEDGIDAATELCPGTSKKNEMKLQISSFSGPKPKSFSMIPGDRATKAAVAISKTGHAFKKGVSRLTNKAERCELCMKNIGGFLSPCYKCTCCKLCFHKECVEFASKFPCTPTSPIQSKRSKAWELPHSSKKFSDITRPGQLSPTEVEPKMVWNLTRTSQFHDPTDQILGTFEDLRQMSIFIFRKIMDLKSKCRQQRETVMDAIFRKSLEEFHAELLSHQATLKEDQIQISYADLIVNFQGALSKVSADEKIIFPVLVGVNGFRGFLNEFVNTKKKKDKIKAKEKAKKKRRKSDVTTIQGHRLKPDLVHVPTYCEVCDQFMWHSEKIFICLGCRISCHKKCHNRIVHSCPINETEATTTFVGRFFGADLVTLLDDDHPTPIIFEKLLSAIEFRGLFCEGLYRKTGSVAQTKQVRRQIEETPDFDQVTFNDTPVHLLTTLVKGFLRELTEPLMTYDLYENFLTVAEVASENERQRCIYAMVELLPKANKAVLDRLMFHLARVAHHSAVNKMSSQNLAVIFAPCLLKRQQMVKAQEQLDDCSRQTTCIQTLIDDKLKHLVSAISDIVEVESAQEKVEENLRLIDEHITMSRRESDSSVLREMEQARLLFEEQFEFLDQTRDKLLEELPPLAPTASSEDDCLTSGDENCDEVPCSHKKGHRNRQLVRQHTEMDEYAIDMTMPPLFSNLVHLTKNRVSRPKGQRKPSRFCR